MAEHLDSSIRSYRAALEAQTRQELPQGWAATQNNLGNTLWSQAERTSGPEAVRLMAESVKAFRAALEVYTDAEFPQRRAITLRNLESSEAQLRVLQEQTP